MSCAAPLPVTCPCPQGRTPTPAPRTRASHLPARPAPTCPRAAPGTCHAGCSGAPRPHRGVWRASRTTATSGSPPLLLRCGSSTWPRRRWHHPFLFYCLLCGRVCLCGGVRSSVKALVGAAAVRREGRRVARRPALARPRHRLNRPCAVQVPCCHCRRGWQRRGGARCVCPQGPGTPPLNSKGVLGKRPAGNQALSATADGSRHWWTSQAPPPFFFLHFS